MAIAQAGDVWTPEKPDVWTFTFSTAASDLEAKLIDILVQMCDEPPHGIDSAGVQRAIRYLVARYGA